MVTCVLLCEVSMGYLSILVRRGSPRIGQVPVAIKGLPEDRVVGFLSHCTLHTHTHTHTHMVMTTGAYLYCEFAYLSGCVECREIVSNNGYDPVLWVIVVRNTAGEREREREREEGGC